MPGPSVSLTLFEPVTYLRGQSSTLDSSRARLRNAFSLHQDEGGSQPSQLRGLVTVTLPKPTRIKTVELVLSGMGRTDWPEGIGSNRLELAELAPIIKEEVVLFDAKAEEAPSAPLRRANSIGPGVTGGTDDVDWSLDLRAGDAATNISSKGKEKEKKTPNLARSVGKVAVKAGSAILPPTLLRELAHSRPEKKEKGHTSDITVPSSIAGSPDDRRRTSGSAEQAPPQYQPETPSDSAPYVGRGRSVSLLLPQGPTSSTVENAPSSELSALSNDGRNSFLPSSTTMAQSGPALPPQSVSAAGPHGRSILHSPRRARSPLQDTRHPSRTRMIADPSSGTQPRIRDPSDQGVRFDSRTLETDDDAAGRRNLISTIPMEQGEDGHGETSYDRQRDSSSSLTRQLKRDSSVSGASSGRTSEDRNPNLLESSSKAKGKAKATSDAAARDSTSRKGAFKSLLGGLRKEDGGQRRESRSSSAPRPSASRSQSVEGSVLNAASSGSASLVDKSSASECPNRPHQSTYFHPPTACDWREFKKGTYTYPISLPLPANLPPTIHADFGSNRYTLKALVRRAGALTPNLSCEKEVVLIHAPDEEGGEETDSIVVERTWEDALTYRVFVSGRSFACGSKVPLWIKFIPLGEKIRIWRLTVVLEEKTHYYAKRRKIARHETPRRFTLLKLSPTNDAGEASTSTAVDMSATCPLLPILSESTNALEQSPLGQYAIAAARLGLPAQILAQNNSILEGRGFPSPSEQASDEDDELEPLGDEARQDALATLLDPGGPWELSMDVALPGKGSRINTSTDHKRSNITVEHFLRLTFRVEKARPGASVGDKPMLFDIVIEAPVTINHSHTADAWLSLPNYWAVANVDPPRRSSSNQPSAGSRSVPCPRGSHQDHDAKAVYRPVPEAADYFTPSHYQQGHDANGTSTSTSTQSNKSTRSPSSTRDRRDPPGPTTATSGDAVVGVGGGGGGGGAGLRQARRDTAESSSAANQWLHLSERSDVQTFQTNLISDPTSLGTNDLVNAMALTHLQQSFSEGETAGAHAYSSSDGGIGVGVGVVGERLEHVQREPLSASLDRPPSYDRAIAPRT